MKLCIADDHPIVVDGLKEVLHSKGAYEVIGEAYNGNDLLLLLTYQKPDAVIVDINMPGLSGIECTKIIKKRYPSIKVIILTMYNDRSFVNQLIAAGADGCLLKSKGSQELLIALERIRMDKSYFDTVADFKVVSEEKQEIKLSDRELQIVKLVADGMTSQEIAARLCIAEHTVRTHRKNIFKKLNLKSVSQLIRFAINHKLT